MYQLSAYIEENLGDSKSLICTWLEISEWTIRYAKESAKKVDLDLIYALEETDGNKGTQDLYDQLKKCIYLDFMMCFLTYTTMEGGKTKAEIFKHICHDSKKDQIYNDTFYETHKGYLYNTYNNLKKCVNFFDVYSRDLFSSRIDEDFVRFCIIHAGKLPKKRPLRKPYDVDKRKEHVEYNYIKSSKKPCNIFERILDEIKDIDSNNPKRERYQINSANTVLKSSFAAVAYHLEQHYVICSCISYFSVIRQSYPSSFVYLQDIYETEECGMSENQIDHFFTTLITLPTPLIRLALTKVYTRFAIVAERNPKLAFKILVQKDEALKAFHRGLCSEDEIITRAIVEYQNHIENCVRSILHDFLPDIAHKAIETKCEDLTQEKMDNLCYEANEQILMFYRSIYESHLAATKRKPTKKKKSTGKKGKDKALSNINYILNKYYPRYLESIMQADCLQDDPYKAEFIK